VDQWNKDDRWREEISKSHPLKKRKGKYSGVALVA
jgi:hypothetical protein